LKTLGLKCVSKEMSLSDYLSEKYGEQDSNKGRSNVHVNKPLRIAQAIRSMQRS
jgi:hypothetical protein